MTYADFIAENNPASERWQTPPEIWNPLNAEFGFDLDAAADIETKRLPIYLTDALNTLDWPGQVIWMNPPYGRKLAPFVRAAAAQARMWNRWRTS